MISFLGIWNAHFSPVLPFRGPMNDECFGYSIIPFTTLWPGMLKNREYRIGSPETLRTVIGLVHLSNINIAVTVNQPHCR
jgi:hypothetical protein